MASPAIIQRVSPATLGYTLDLILNNQDPYILHRNANQILEKASFKTVSDLITKAYKKYLQANVDVNKDKQLEVNSLRSGDIIVQSNQRAYVVTTVAEGNIRTWPELPAVDQRSIAHKVIRPNFENIDDKYLNTISSTITETVSPEEKEEQNKGATFREGKSFNLSDGYLQIGDIGFLVDPTQLSFTTQNGYQYFPTLRSAGNPKIPTMQQVKNISLSLIFPNSDAINYQLLNLFAMFKRTPFVNVRNKDICAFFQDICFGTEWPERWLSVALESIQIQSVEGFPNTLQAQISLRPFDPSSLSSKFSGLRSFKDVEEQQRILYNDDYLEYLIRKSKQKLIDDGSIGERVEDVINKTVNSSHNFKESLPFRVFYQSMINGRDYVTDEHGNAVTPYSTGAKVGDQYPLDGFRPTNIENRLNQYGADANKAPIKFTYNYIDGQFRDALSKISRKKLSRQAKEVNSLNMLLKPLLTPRHIVEQLTTTFLTTKDYYKEFEYKFSSTFRNTIPTLLANRGITLDQEEPERKPILRVLGYFFKSFGRSFGIEEKAIIYDQLKDISKGKLDKDSVDVLGMLNGVLYHETGNMPMDNSSGVKTVQSAINSLWDWLNRGTDKEADKKKENFNLFLEDLRTGILAELGFDNGEPAHNITVAMKQEEVEIDNTTDVTIGWSLSFNNKFIPMTLESHKYPYYQHIGQDDISLSLNIMSTNSSKINDLKTELSLLSERIQETVKIVTFTAPELMGYLDSRLTINVPLGHVFKTFGVDKVVYDTSTSTNIQQQPGSWSTNVNFTQAKFTIDQYHQINSEEQMNLEKIELSKLLAKTEWDGKQFVVKKYIDKENDKLVSDIGDVLGIRFFSSNHGRRTIDHIGVVGNQLKKLQLKRNAKQRRAQYTANSLAVSSAQPFENPADAIGDNARTSTAEIESALVKQSEGILAKKFSIENIDEAATKAINTMAMENPEVAKILRYVIKKVDNIFAQQADTLITLIQPQKNLFETMWDSIVNKSSAKTAGFTGTIVSIIAIFGAPAWLPWALGGLGIAGIAGAAGFDFLSGVAKDAILSGFGDNLLTMVDAFNIAVVGNLATRIIKDPIIRDNLLNADVVGPKAMSRIEAKRQLKRINCYKDFDIPSEREGPNKTLLLSPDFYLFNRLDDNSTIASYITAAVERIAQVGKIHAMTSLLESTDAIKRYNDIIKEAQGIDDKVKEGVNVVLRDTIPNTSDEPNLDQLIEHLDRAHIDLARATNSYEGTPDKDLIKIEYVANYKAINPREQAKDKDLWDSELVALETLLDSGSPLVFKNNDYRKLNLIHAARLKTLIEIFEVYVEINETFKTKLISDNYSLGVVTNSGAEKESDKENDVLYKRVSETKLVDKLRRHITTILENAENITSKSMVTPDDTFKDTDKAVLKELKEQNKNGRGNPDEVILSLPDMKNVQEYLYSRINAYIRLNSFIHENAGNTSGRIDFSTLPEFQYLNYWNFRAKEDSIRQAEFLKQLTQKDVKRKETTIKMFPTYKIYLIEEDNSFATQDLDDYYSYEAIQSIEIVANKSSAGKTAVLRLSNVNNNLTNKQSFYRESKDLLGQTNITNSKDRFLGTLDIKAGTKLMIKLGYGPDDTMLNVAFIGRIIEMNVGPIVEMICQSFGAQLNHEVVAEKFGMLSANKDHGDVASAILDTIPGLEGLGKLAGVGSVDTGDFTGRNIRKVKGKLADKFLLSNLFGSVSASIFAQDNPRDDNVYLPYSYISSVYHRPTFDWVIFNQTVWDAIKEITLYHRDSIATVKPFNDDPLSRLHEQRETLVVGKKAGYYKFTDAFSFSTFNIKQIEQAVKDVADLVAVIKDGNNAFLFEQVYKTHTAGVIDNTLDLVTDNKRKAINKVFRIITDNPTTRNFWDSGTIKKDYHASWLFLQNRINSLLLTTHILGQTEAIKSDAKSIDLMLSQLTDSKFIANSYSETITYILSFANLSAVPPKKISKLSVSQSEERTVLFIKSLSFLAHLVNKENVTFEMSPEEYYNIKDILTNDGDDLRENPQYRKIQDHHIVSDIGNLISNNISLTSDFANAVNVYYTDEPKLNSARVGDMSDAFISNNLHIFQAKAFGDTRDEHTRVLNSYQKNIDPNWYDIIRKNTSLFKSFKRIKDETKGNKATNIKDYLTEDGVEIDKDIPNWKFFPSYFIIAVRLLQEQIAKMYQGTLEIVGDSSIKPYDIIHLDDRVNDMTGAIEVEEVIHSFTPERGFRTTITPNLITYDRNPLQLQDTQIINQIYDYAQEQRRHAVGWTAVGAGMVIGGALLAAYAGQVVTGAGVALGGAPILYNGLVGGYSRYHKFIYDMAGKILGRDCINFSALIYHGAPFMSGFDGVDYTSLKTLMNHKALGVRGNVSRVMAFSDPFRDNIITNFNPKSGSAIKLLLSRIPILNSFFNGFDTGNSGLKGGAFGVTVAGNVRTET